MRFRPANIRLINRRLNLPRLLLALSSINGKSNDKNNTTKVQELTGHSISGLLCSYCRVLLCLRGTGVHYF
jgi:hypothetical protein